MEKRKTILVLACIRQCALYQKEMREAFEMVSAHNARRVQLSVLRLWNFNYLKQLDTKGKTGTLASRKREQLLHTHLSQWYLLTNLRIQRKLSLKKLRIKNRLRLCFTQIKAHASERSTFRARLHRFLKLRAIFLLARSFTGLTTFTRQRLLNIKLNKVSRYVHLRRLLLSSFSRLKTFHLRIQAYKLVNCRTKLKLVHSILNRWKTEYLRTDIGKKLSTRRETVKVFKCLHMLRAKTKELKRLRLIGGKISAKKSAQRKGKALKAWYLQKLMQQKHMALEKLSLKYNHKRLCRVACNRITLYASLRKQRKLQMKALHESRQSKLVYAFFSILKSRVIQSKTYAVIAQPLRETYKRSVIRRALCALYTYGYSKYVLTVKGQRAEKVHQRHLKEKAYSSLIDAVIVSKQTLVQYRTARAYDQQRVMRQALYSLLKYKILNRYARDVIKGQQLTQMHRYMSVWYELYVDCQGQKALFEIAENHYLQKVFSKFLSAYHVFKLTERVKRAKRLRALTLYSKSLATYAFGVFKLFLAGCREQRLQHLMATQQRASTVLNSWRSIRILLQSENLKRKLSQGFRRQHLLSQSFIHLALIANDKKRQALKIEYMRSVWANNVKKHGMHALCENIGRQQKIREFFSGKKDTFSRILMRSALLQWQSKLMTLNLEETALWFRNVVWPKTILRRCLRSFSAFTIRSQALSSAFTTVSKSTRTQVKASYTVHWLLAAAHSRALRARLDAFSQKHREQSLGRVFYALQRAVIVKKTVRNHGEQAEIVRYSTLARKAMVALQRNQCLQQTAKYVTEKVAAQRIHKVFCKWRRDLQVNFAGVRLGELLDRLTIRSQAQTFLRKLAKHCEIQRITQYIQSQHVLRRCLLFFDLLRTRMIYKRIVQSCQLARELHQKRQVFNTFKLFAQLRVQHHSILELQVETLVGEANREVAACAFASLQINARQGRLKRVANYRYRQCLLRKGILSLAIVAQKLKICKYGKIELEIKRKARFFVLWYEAIAAHRTASVARKVLRINKQSRIIDQWRAVVCKDRMAGAHHYNNCQKSMLPQAFEALKGYSQKKRYLRFCQHEISQNREFVLIKEVMLAWLQHHNMKRIQFNMQRFYQFKLVKNIIDSWRLIQIQNSYKRRCRLHIKEALRGRPELAKPLLALRYHRSYQAFHAFRLGIRNVKRLKEIEGYSSYAFYIRMLQRGFEGLRLAAIKRQQKRNVVVISEMLVLRRWFAELREAVRVKKWGKQARIESAIFNFLSIQRKGFNSLLEYAQIKKQERLKIMLATDIYAKSLIIKAFSALRQAVLDKPQVSGEGTGYLIQCDIAQFDHHGSFAPLSTTSQPMKQYSFDHTYSGFEANKSHLLNPTMIYNDRSNLYSTALHEGGQGTNTNSTSNNNTMILIHGGPTQELEFSHLGGEDDREAMADELYLKKRLYQCFIGWLSTLGEVEQ